MKRLLATLVKILFSALLIVFLFYFRDKKIDVQEVINHFSQVKIGWLIAGASLHFTGLIFSGIRWQILLNAQGIRQPFSRLVSYYLVGHFFNMFLPTKVGGDVVRIYDTSRDHGSAAQPVAVILVERISGMLTMLLLAVVVLLLNIDIGFDYRSRVPGLDLGLLVFIIAVCLFPFTFHPKMETLIFDKLLTLPVLKWARGFPLKIYKAFQVYGGKLRHLFCALVAGTLLQLNYFLHYYFLARALGMDSLNLMFFFVLIPIRTAALMIPFFINGIGLREFFDVTAFGLMGIAESQAVAFAELAWFVQIGFALLGGLVYAFRKRVRKPEDTNR